MLPLPFFAMILSLFGVSDPQQGVRRVVVQDTVVFRIPVRPTPPMAIEWVESKGPRCIPADVIRGASVRSPNEIDFLLTHRRRVRAEIDRDCPAIDFYTGFYVEPRDDRLCAKRDELRSRMGGHCEIRRFRALTPQLKR